MKMNKQVVGIAGKARAGKDTVAMELCKLYDCSRYAFANPVKEAVRCVFGFSDEQLYGDLKDVVDPFWGVTPRHVLQRFGTEAMRGTFGHDIWLQVARRYVEASDAPIVIITDVRFENEAAWVRSTGGTVLHILRPETQHLSDEAKKHASEAGIAYADGDLLIDNNGTLDDLRAKVYATGQSLRLRVGAANE